MAAGKPENALCGKASVQAGGARPSGCRGTETIAAPGFFDASWCVGAFCSLKAALRPPLLTGFFRRRECETDRRAVHDVRIVGADCIATALRRRKTKKKIGG